MTSIPPQTVNITINRVEAKDPDRWLKDMEKLVQERMAKSRKTCWTIQLHEHIATDLTRVWYWTGRGHWSEHRGHAVQFTDTTSAQAVAIAGVPPLMLRYVEVEVLK